MKIENFIDRSLVWNTMVCPNRTIEEQTAIVEAEQEEFYSATTHKEKVLECADVVWTLAYLQDLYKQKGDFLKEDECRRKIWQFSSHHDRKAFQACSDSNYSKIISDKNDALIDASILDATPRYSDVEVKGNNGFWWLVGTDWQNAYKPQRNKLLKPLSYVRKEDLY